MMRDSFEILVFFFIALTVKIALKVGNLKEFVVAWPAFLNVGMHLTPC
mgnify:CR=1 FL=1